MMAFLKEKRKVRDWVESVREKVYRSVAWLACGKAAWLVSA